MKKLKWVFVLLFTVIFISNFNLSTSYAEDDGYYIENMDVQVKVNDKREYIITETIDAFFDEERHGIIRTIPKSTDLEDYQITNIDVKGAPYVEEDSSSLVLKIGDEDETIVGEQRYIITYTIECFDDEQTNGDYIYLNVLGNEWDTDIKKFTATITYPENSNLEKLTITNGKYGDTHNTLVNYSQNNNKIEITSKQTISPNNGVTVNAKLNEGSFKNAPTRTYPYTIKNDVINADISKEKTYSITRDLTVEINENIDENNLHSIYIWNSTSRDYIKNVKINSKDITFNESNNSLLLPSKEGIYNFKVTFNVEPPIMDNVKFHIGDFSNEGKIENVKLKVTSPFTINDCKVDFYQHGVNMGTDRYKFNIDNDTLSFENLNNLNLKESATLTLDIDNSLFSISQPSSYYIAIGFSFLALLLILFLYFKNKDKEKLISAVEFYPPKNLNPSEVAFAYKGSVSSRDIISLIFYWASHKHIKLKINKDDSFIISKTNDLDDQHKPYEINIFNDLFNAGCDDIVSDKDLKSAEIKSIDEASREISSYFKNENSLEDLKSYSIGRLIGLLAGIPNILVLYYNSVLCHESPILGISFGMLLAALLFIFSNMYMSLANKRYYKSGIKKAIISGVILSTLYIIVFLLVIGFTNISGFIVLLLLFINLLGLILSGLVTKKSKYGKEILAHILGFKNFIEVAEKSRLEALLEESPDYFYSTLPYAQVLGVTKIWVEKFDGIRMKQPDYYDTYYSMTDIYIMSSLLNSFDRVNEVVDSSRYTPPSDGSGGFGSGGFSGGGSGGGGGSSW
ncbi:MAG: DUF2207 domain-containing protein [Terrisporobacter sp.]